MMNWKKLTKIIFNKNKFNLKYQIIIISIDLKE